MKKFVIIGLAVAAASAAIGLAASAQPSLPLPPGSWRDSCGEARVTYQSGARVLSARCVNPRGGQDYSTLRYEECRGDIANNKGRLVCGNPGPIPPRPPAALPDGSYKASCRDATVRDGRLYAECRNARGAWNRTSIVPGMCRDRDIANVDGELQCSGRDSQIPPGSYRQSCRDARTNGSMLYAECRDSRGVWQRASIDARTCNGRDIANNNGRLVCAGGPAAQLPNGSYQQSCRNARIDRDRLVAECRDRRGTWISSSLDYNNCRNSSRDIANVDGRLTCALAGGGGGQLPAGSWRSSCDQAYMTGATLVATCRDSRGQRLRSSLDTRSCNGRDIANIEGRLTCSGGGSGGGFGALTLCSQPNYGGRCITVDRESASLGDFGDRAESARVRGRWTVCEHDGFRGRCATLDRDTADLNRQGLGRMISSARPVR